MRDILEQSRITAEGVQDAKAKVEEYRASVRERHEAEDEAILRGYRALAKGHSVIDLPSVVRRGGVFSETGLPRLAVATASHEFVHATRDRDGSVAFHPELPWGSHLYRRVRDVYRCPPGTLPQSDFPTSARWSVWRGGRRAMVPHVPPALRPRAHLRNYCVLFEVEDWAVAPLPPGDPALLKHLGGDLYAILAVWDLTDLERSVLMGRTRAGR